MNAHYGKLDPFEFEQAEKEKPKCPRCLEEVESEDDLFCVDAIPNTLSEFICSTCLSIAHNPM